MNIFDIILIVCIAAGVILAVRHMRNDKSGCCGDCTQCSRGCSECSGFSDCGDGRKEE